MSAEYDVFIIGELNADVLLKGDVTPAFGQVEKLVDDFTLCAGSSSGIFAAGCARLGLRVCLASRVGDDVLGHFIIDELGLAGVDASHVTVDPCLKTGATVILSRGQDRAMLTFLGSIAEVSLRDLPAGWENMAKHLHVASPFLLKGLHKDLPEIMACAHRAGMTVSLDTNWDPSGRWEVEDLLDQTDVFLPNEQELLAITRTTTLDEGLAVALSRVPVVAVKRGAEGAMGAWRTRDGSTEFASVAALPVQVVDTTGAGDSFDAGFLAAWFRGMSLQECLAVGAVCGALTSTVPGGFAGQPTWEEANRVAERHLASLGSS